MKRRKITSIFLVMIIFFISVIAYAHKPVFVKGDISSLENAKLIEKPEISWAIYSSLTPEKKIDYYKIQGKKGMNLYLQMLIPKIKGLENFTPTIAIIGKEFPGLEQELMFDIPQGYGLRLINPVPVKREFFEPFTQTRYLIRQEEIIKLESNDIYYIAVYNHQGDIGKYTLAIGKKEQFGIIDIIKFPYTWLKVRLWYSIGETILILSAVVILLTVVILAVIRIVQHIRK